ncbi:hypothetical protein AVEN_199476-1 [Araneus ventricosus]|uniref:Uncharacterized protein n=1 Tax=Araneus ventricosus TaxID=182803 RepID=A0A4Y1ZQK3_ARAVE|nr:hypothetical protein AVEN_58600-1 [Araneus ventricosus]GBL62183.1 hypothetical protein AVEN_156238-1 [Araneus ventricosus]GBL62208.1 hypothetical protein AVEN_199476-1 [Araneus ventricosus]
MSRFEEICGLLLDGTRSLEPWSDDEDETWIKVRYFSRAEVPNLWYAYPQGYARDQLEVCESHLVNGGEKLKNILEFRFLKFVCKMKVKIVRIRKSIHEIKDSKKKINI